MAYEKEEWLDRSNSLFDAESSPEVDAATFNRIESGIYNIDEALDNLSTAYGIFSSSTQQPILITKTDLTWEVDKDSTDSNIFEFNDTNNTITFKKPGTFNFKSNMKIGSTTNNSLLFTVKIVDSLLDTVWHTESILLDINTGLEKSISSSKGLKFIQADVPKTLKITFSADGIGMNINSINYTLNTLASGATASGDHSDLSGTSDDNCHPISAITNLNDTLTGISLNGEAI